METPLARIDDTEEAEYGPAMKALKTDKRRAFVNYVISTGGTNMTKAAQHAGYASNSEQAASVAGYKLSHDPRIIAALREEGERRVGTHLGMALQTIIDIASTPLHKDAFKAATAIAAMAGVQQVQRSEHHVVHHTSLMDDVRAAAAVLGVDPDALMRGRLTDQSQTPIEVEGITLLDPEGSW